MEDIKFADGKRATITSVMERITAEIYDKYCKYPAEYLQKYSDPDAAHDKMLDDRCWDCPLSKI